MAWTARLSKNGKRRFRDKVTPRVTVEDQVVKVAVPEGSHFKGHEAFLLQDLVTAITNHSRGVFGGAATPAASLCLP